MTDPSPTVGPQCDLTSTASARPVRAGTIPDMAAVANRTAPRGMTVPTEAGACEGPALYKVSATDEDGNTHRGILRSAIATHDTVMGLRLIVLMEHHNPHCPTALAANSGPLTADGATLEPSRGWAGSVPRGLWDALNEHLTFDGVGAALRGNDPEFTRHSEENERTCAHVLAAADLPDGAARDLALTLIESGFTGTGAELHDATLAALA